LIDLWLGGKAWSAESNLEVGMFPRRLWCNYSFYLQDTDHLVSFICRRVIEDFPILDGSPLETFDIKTDGKQRREQDDSF